MQKKISTGWKKAAVWHNESQRFTSKLYSHWLSQVVQNTSWRITTCSTLVHKAAFQLIFLKTQLIMKTSMAENKRCEALLIRWKDKAGSYFTNAYQFCLTPLWWALMHKKCWLKRISALDEVAVIWKGHTTHRSRRESTWLNNLKNRNCCGLVLLQ